MARRSAFARAHGDGGGGGHDGGGMMRWLLTYADMITLLTAFFIMMYSMSVLNLAKFKQVAISVRSGFGGKLEGAGIFKDGGVVYMDNPDEVPNPGPPLTIVMKRLNEYVKKYHLEGEVTARMEERGLVISLTSDGLLFDLGRAQLLPDAQYVVDAVAAILVPVGNDVIVEGHTCDLPISTPQFPSNWELSAARAIAVVRYLIDKKGVPVKRIGAAGYADSRPYVPNTSEQNRRRNRRVDIVVLAGATTVLHNAQTAPEASPPPSSSAKWAPKASSH